MQVLFLVRIFLGQVSFAADGPCNANLKKSHSQHYMGRASEDGTIGYLDVAFLRQNICSLNPLSLECEIDM